MRAGSDRAVPEDGIGQLGDKFGKFEMAVGSGAANTGNLMGKVAPAITIKVDGALKLVMQGRKFVGPLLMPCNSELGSIKIVGKLKRKLI